MINARAVPSIEVDQLIHFAVSVFWRAGAWTWNALDHGSQIDLGPYQERFRRFLLGEESFPERAVLIGNISNNPQPHVGAIFPFSNRVNGVWQHRFSIPGMAFWLHLGHFRDAIPAFCAVRSGVVFYSDTLNDNFEREMGALMGTARPAPGLR